MVPEVGAAMTCHRIQVDGAVAIVCERGPKQRCDCGRKVVALCDGPPRRSRQKTCSRKLCDQCVVALPDGRDLCGEHAAEETSRRSELERDTSPGSSTDTSVRVPFPHAAGCPTVVDDGHPLDCACETCAYAALIVPADRGHSDLCACPDCSTSRARRAVDVAGRRQLSLFGVPHGA